MRTNLLRSPKGVAAVEVNTERQLQQLLKLIMVLLLKGLLPRPQDNIGHLQFHNRVK